jgi:thiamine-phosphate pyrophosphorylase
LRRLKLNSLQKYLITDPSYYQNLEKTLAIALERHVPNYVCFRDKGSQNLELEAASFIKIAKKHNQNNLFLNGSPSLAKKLGFDGVHLTSSNLTADTLGLKVIASTHNELEIATAINQNIELITYGPIFDTPNKGEAKGVEHLKNIVEKYSIKIFALGGIITENEARQLHSAKPFGFASIRYFI